MLHLDEQTGHIHLLVVPRIAKPEGGWKLNSKALFDRARLRELQTAYGEAVAPLGIQRGLAGSIASHTSVKQFYGAVITKKPPLPALDLPKPPKKPEGSTGVRALVDGIAAAIGIKSGHDEKKSKYEEEFRAWQAEVREAKQARRLAWEDLQRRADYSTLANRKHAHSGRPSPLEGTRIPRADRMPPKATEPSKKPRVP